MSIATLDCLSEGRVILGAGLGGVPQEFTAFGESDDARERAQRLDEGLEVLNRLWAGEQVMHRGRHYTVENVTLSPLPVQHPRVPIWIGGESLPALRRASRWDGWVVGGDNERAEMVKTPEQIAEKVAYLQRHRSDTVQFDVALTGCSTSVESAFVHEFAAVGVTWWLESLHGFRGSFDVLLARVRSGPPV